MKTNKNETTPKPCRAPRCAEVAEKRSPKLRGDFAEYWVDCPMCHMAGPISDSPEGAVELWGRLEFTPEWRHDEPNPSQHQDIEVRYPLSRSKAPVTRLKFCAVSETWVQSSAMDGTDTYWRHDLLVAYMQDPEHVAPSHPMAGAMPWERWAWRPARPV